jgi:hypothetical protein
MKPHTHTSPRRFSVAAKSWLLAALLPAAIVPLHAQTQPAPAPAEAAADNNNAPVSNKLSDADLDDLLGPIALYPDALISIILPASTVPSDITMADRFLQKNGDNANVDNQPWDDSVRSLARYPDVLKWMDDNLEWTTSVGEAFVAQPADVMNSIQRLRLAAKDKGNLVNTPQQTVVVEKEPKAPQKEVIRIVPTEPDVIYVPQYDPQVVYYEPAPVYEPDYTPLITFGVGFAVGAWLNYDCDWNNDTVYYGPGCGWNNQAYWWNRGWNDGNVNVVTTNTNITNNYNNVTYNNNGTASAAAVRAWQPSAASQRMVAQRQRENIGNARIAAANRAARVDARQEHRQNARENRQANRAAAAAQVPRPTRLAVNNNRAQPNAAARRQAQDRAQAAKVQAAQPNNAARTAEQRRAQAQANANRAAQAHPGATPPRAHKPTTAAPNVAGQPGGTPRAGKPHRDTTAAAGAQNTPRPHHKPTTAAPGQAQQQNRQSQRQAADRPRTPAPQAETQRQKNRNDAARAERSQQQRQSQAQSERQSQARQQQAQAERQQQQRQAQAQAERQQQRQSQAQQERRQQQRQQADRPPQAQQRPRPQQSNPQAQAQRQQQQHRQQAQGGQQQQQQKKKKDQD